MKWPLSDTPVRISRLFQILALLASFKIALLGYSLLPQFPVSGHPESTAVAVVQAVTPPVAMAAEDKAKNEKKTKTPAPKNSKNQKKDAEILDKLRAREDELNRKEQDLKNLEIQLDRKLAEMSKLEQSIKKMLEEADNTKDKKVKHLVSVYTNMKPKQAALVLETLDQDLAVKILSGMQGRTAGGILSYVKPKIAAQLSEKLTNLQIPFK